MSLVVLVIRDAVEKVSNSWLPKLLSLIHILNSLSVAGLVKLDPKLVAFDDGLFEVMLIRQPRSPLDMRRIVRHLRRGRYDGDEILFFKTGSLSVTSDSPVPWTCLLYKSRCMIRKRRMTTAFRLSAVATAIVPRRWKGCRMWQIHPWTSSLL